MKAKDFAVSLVETCSIMSRPERAKVIYKQALNEMKERTDARCRGKPSESAIESVGAEVLRWGEALDRCLPKDFVLGKDGKSKTALMVILGTRDFIIHTLGYNPFNRP